MQRLAKANNDRRAAEVECDALRRDKLRLSAQAKTLERDVAERAKAPWGWAPGPAVEGEAEGPTDGGGAGGGGRCTAYFGS